MTRPRIPFAPGLAAGILAFALAGCSSSSPTEQESTEFPSFVGSYALSGTFAGRPGQSVHGSLVVSDQVGTTATAAIVLRLTDNGNTFFVLNTTSDVVAATVAPAQAQLGNDGSFSVSYSGREEIFGIDPADCCAFTITFAGRLTDNLLNGGWTLTTDMPSSDTGTFTGLR